MPKMCGENTICEEIRYRFFLYGAYFVLCLEVPLVKKEIYAAICRKMSTKSLYNFVHIQCSCLAYTTEVSNYCQCCVFLSLKYCYTCFSLRIYATLQNSTCLNSFFRSTSFLTSTF